MARAARPKAGLGLRLMLLLVFGALFAIFLRLWYLQVDHGRGAITVPSKLVALGRKIERLTFGSPRR